MKLSLQDLVSLKQTIATTVGATASTDVLDWGAHKDDLTRSLTLFCKVDAAGTFGTDGTVTAAFQTSANNSDWTTLATTKALTALEAGQFVLNQPLPLGLKRYNRVVYTTAVAAFTVAPVFTAGIVRGQVDSAPFEGL